VQKGVNLKEAQTPRGSSTERAKKKPKPALGTIEAMQQKLLGGHFRHLNEELYSTSSKKAMQMFREEPELFDVYHQGFRQQVEARH
jgi:ribosomal RNA-processing protein 8